MIQISAQMRILVAVEPVDFRCGIDALAALCRQRLKADPFCAETSARKPQGQAYAETSGSRGNLRVRPILYSSSDEL